ncbi:MAG: hypothetical protein AAFV53_36960 [Myxococcota bacterium]
MGHQIATLTLLSALCWSAPAMAAWPDDVQLSALDTFNGEDVTNQTTMRNAYERVVQQLGAGVANRPLGATETGGINGFDVALAGTVGFIDAAEDSSAWRRVHPDADPTRALWIPEITVRKGLPLSLEAGARLGYVAFSRQTVFGAWGRLGLLEGYSRAPDLALQIGYAAYLGNPELALGTMDTSLTIGKTFPFGRTVGINTADIAPYLGIGLLQTRAQPRLTDAEQNDLGISAVSGFRSSDDFTEGFANPAIHLGTRILSGDVQVMVGVSVVPDVMSSVSAGIGYVY